MKKLLLLLLLAVPLRAQDTIRVKHGNYESVFSVSKRYPILVEWSVTHAELKCKMPVKRTDKFVPDPTLKKESDIEADYYNSGFDRGHISPAADARCDATHMAESFYFTNMVPQYPGLNRGQWKMLEERTRTFAIEYDSVFVQAGCVGEASKVGKISIPTHCWKVIRTQNQVEAYVFPNVAERSKSLKIHEVTVDSIRTLTKLPIK